MRVNTGPLPRHRSPAEVRHIHDEEACGSARMCSVGCGISNTRLFYLNVFCFGRIAKNAEQYNLALRHSYYRYGVYFPAVRHSADLPRRSQNRETKRRGGCSAKLQPQTATRSGVQSTGNCVSKDDRNRSDGVPCLLLMGHD